MEIKEIKRIVDDAFGVGDIAKNKAITAYKKRANAKPLVLKPKTYREVEFAVRYAISLESDTVPADIHLNEPVSSYLDSLSRFSVILLLEQLFLIEPGQTTPLSFLEKKNLQVSDIVSFFAEKFFPRYLVKQKIEKAVMVS